jgi:hypothetical protein
MARFLREGRMRGVRAFVGRGCSPVCSEGKMASIVVRHVSLDLFLSENVSEPS